jgi:hypothetical protein
MLIKKYITPSCLSPRGRKRPCSKIWAGCKVGGQIFNKGLRWKIHYGDSVNVWRDFWLPSGPLRDKIEGLFAFLEDALLVSDLYRDNSWNLDLLLVELPLAIQQEIITIFF